MSGRRALALLGLVAAVVALPAHADPLTSAGLVDETVAGAPAPRAYDWRRASFEVQTAYAYIDEANNFESAAYELAGAVPLGDGSLVRFGLRRAELHATSSSNDLGRTPFTQNAQSTRYELFGHYDFGLVEGKAMTRLGASFPDVDTAIFVVAGGHYAHKNASWIPKRDDPPKPLPGQKDASTTTGLELGLRWQIWTPSGFGIGLEALRVLPLARGVPGSNFLALGALWSLGAK